MARMGLVVRIDFSELTHVQFWLEVLAVDFDSLMRWSPSGTFGNAQPTNLGDDSVHWRLGAMINQE